MTIRSRRPSEKFLSGEDVRTWRISRNLTSTEIGKWLGLTPQAILRYEAKGATKSTALALAALDAGLRPYKPTHEDIRAVKDRDRLKHAREDHEAKTRSPANRKTISKT